MSLKSLPSGWVATTLEAVSDWASGGTPSRSNEAYFNGDIPWIKTGELGAKFIHSAEEKITPQAIQNSSAKIFPKGSVGIAMYGATIGKVSIWGINASTNQACAVATPIEGLLFNEFLYYYLLSQRRELIKAGKGGAQPNISQGVLKEWPIHLPPISEQYRIVAKIEELLSELDKGIENLGQARAQLAVYRQALLRHAFEGKLTAEWRSGQALVETADELSARLRVDRDARYRERLAAWESASRTDSKRSKPKQPPGVTLPSREELAKLPDLPPGWNWLRLGEANLTVSDGPFGSNLKTSDYVDSGVRVVRLENIGVLKFIEEKRSFISDEKYEFLRDHTVIPGDIVFSSFINERTRVAIVPPSIDKAVNKADCFCIRCSNNILLNTYACLFLASRVAYKQLEAAVHGVGRPRINTTQLKEMFIPICSPPEQLAVINGMEAQLSEVDRIEDDINTNLQRAEALRQSILKKAFAGELVPQDPNDEPAATLLSRIRAKRADIGEAPIKRHFKSPAPPRAGAAN